MNSLYNELNGQNNSIINEQIANEAKQIMKNSEKINQILGFFGGKGLNIEQLVRRKCSECGISVEQLMSEVKKYYK